MIILIMTRWLSVTWWTWTAQHTCLRAPAQQARFDGEEYSMKRNISNIFTYILLNNKPGLPEKNTRCLRHHGKRIHHWNQFFILHHLLDYHQKRRSQGQAKYKMIPPQPDTNTTEGQLMVKELKGARFLIQIYSLWFVGGLFWVSLNLFGLMTLSHNTRCLNGRHNLVARGSYCGRFVEKSSAYFAFKLFFIALFTSSCATTCLRFCSFTI